MFHSFRKAEVPNAARIALVCMRDACGGRDMVCTQSIAAATESYRRCLTRCTRTRANPCSMPPKWRRGKLCTVAKLYLKRARGIAQKTSASHQEQLAHINSDYHPRHPLRPTCSFQGKHGAGPCVCLVVLRLAGGVLRGAWVPQRPAIYRAVVRAKGGCPVAGGAAPASNGRVRAKAWAGPGDGGVEDPDVGDGDPGSAGICRVDGGWAGCH